MKKIILISFLFPLLLTNLASAKTTIPNHIVQKQSVPFVYQGAGGWKDLRLAQGCEESAILMAVEWAQNQNFSRAQSIQMIKQISDYEQGRFGTFIDSSAADTATLMKEYFGQDSQVSYGITVRDLRNVVAAGHIAIVHVNGTRVGNPHYGNPPANHHVLLVTGYDYTSNQFIVNDPGVRSGASWRIPASRLQNALEDYPTGNNVKTDVITTSMIEVSR